MMAPGRIPGLVLGMLAALATILLPSSGLAGSDDPFAAQLDAGMPALLEKYGVPGSVVSYIQDGDVAWTRACGLADLTFYLPAWFPDFWPTVGSHALTIALLAWVAYSVAVAFFPRVAEPVPAAARSGGESG